MTRKIYIYLYVEDVKRVVKLHGAEEDLWFAAELWPEQIIFFSEEEL